MHISLVNLGCKVNQYELQALNTALTKKGHTVSGEMCYADVYILNTCAVTNEAERKSRQFVTKAYKRNKDAKIIVMGCASQNNVGAFAEKGVHYVVGSFEKAKISEIIDGLGDADVAEFQSVKSYGSADARDRANHTVYEKTEYASTDRTRQFIKIQDGCDNFCSYCIIPYLRGSSRSREAGDVIDEIASVTLGEVVLIGINLSAYGKDTGTSLTALLNQIREKTPDVRLRLGSLEANVVDDEFLCALRSLKNFCPHFHLSLQSGDDGVLKDMNRRYDAQYFFERVTLIRKYFARAAITTDIIVGFPTESEEAFSSTLKFAEMTGFSDIHVFPYSARNGTRAAELKERVSDSMIKERVKRLTELKLRLKKEYIKSFLGETVETLIENIADDGTGFAFGYSPNYIRVYAGGRFKVGGIYKISLKEDFLDGAKGEKVC
ncbi:MAG: tRNA (N(6)-L-threonylcarbamoyladenosine(37)-C(2))-methylthiotransferase MtaB [Clostridiales bacterium]|jgi:threonylcarbamoyladenosine tRNA methylthiotransferase MtaB|nr:tRNA (N(6)-L-threonylcarbamoyladenosine(37)-C(2))-methylthiotransferase MtaB [Clostridiales bacterium]